MFQATLFGPCFDQVLMSGSLLSESPGRSRWWGLVKTIRPAAIREAPPHFMLSITIRTHSTLLPAARPFRGMPPSSAPILPLLPKLSLQQKTRTDHGPLKKMGMVKAAGLPESDVGLLRSHAFNFQNGVKICFCFRRREFSIDSRRRRLLIQPIHSTMIYLTASCVTARVRWITPAN